MKNLFLTFALLLLVVSIVYPAYAEIAETAGYTYVTGNISFCKSWENGRIENSLVPVGSSSVFQQHETVWALLELRHVVGKHRYKVVYNLNGVFAGEYEQPGWKNELERYPWDYSYFTPVKEDVRPGNHVWDFYIDMDDGRGFTFLESDSLAVIRTDPDYEFVSSVFCEEIVDGSEPHTKVAVGIDSIFSDVEQIYNLFTLENIWVDHRIQVDKVHIVDGKENNYGSYTSDWHDVGAFGWKYSYSMPYQTNLWLGDWFFIFYVQTRIDGVESEFELVADRSFVYRATETYVESAPESFALSQNYPNPFNPTTTINFSLKESGQASIEVFSISGQKVATLADAQFSSGLHSVSWDASSLSAGTYFYTIRAGEFTGTKKMTLLK